MESSTSRDFVIRASCAEQLAVLHRNAFGDVEGPEIEQLVRDLLDDASGQPRLSLVAEIDGALVGHVLFTSVTIEPGSHRVPT